MTRRAIIIGAGPAGLTAALELLRRTDIRPIVLEASPEIGGISRTIRYKGNRMDIGGHRFFSKSDRVMRWWMEMMPLEMEGMSADTRIQYRGESRPAKMVPNLENRAPGGVAGSRRDMNPRIADDSDANSVGGVGVAELRDDVDEAAERETAQKRHADPDYVMLIRPRKSRIYYLRKFFDYPIKLTGQTLRNLGLFRTIRIGASYLASRFRQITPERSLEDLLTNRFGRELYLTFFKSYTEKVWSTPCDRISAEWGAQRIKGLSLTSAVKHFLKKKIERPNASSSGDVAQTNTETSLIERFMYPKLGPGQLWERVADEINKLGGEFHLGRKVIGLECRKQRVISVDVVNDAGEMETFAGDFFFSTMPIRDLVRAMQTIVPGEIAEISEGLQYRDFITVGLLVDRLKVSDPDGGLLKDTWIYIQEPDVLLGRLQIFNNWSPHLVSDPSKIWMGLEYFCNEEDNLWKMDDEALKAFAISELTQIGILEEQDVTDGRVVRVPKAYPAYVGTYERFGALREWIDTFDNLFPIGRNGMHKYNNQDHSMLTAMSVVDGLCAGHVDKAELWKINTEQGYQEEKQSAKEGL